MVKNLPAVQETQVWSLGWEDPLEKEWQPPPVFWPVKSHGQRSLVGCSPWGRKELAMTAWLNFQVWKSNVIYPRFHRGECVNTGGFLPSQHGMEQRDSTRLSSRLLGQHWALGALSSPGCWAHLNRGHTALEVSSLSFLLIFHCSLQVLPFFFFFFNTNWRFVATLRWACLPVPCSPQHYV